MPEPHPSPPKAFVSHSSQDKEAFVLEFARLLRASGVDAWVDKWEMTGGDGLVQKIFEEGIGDAEAMIVVLSRNSVTSKWVREELDAGVVKRIQRGSRIIPIVIDDCEVPVALQSTVWLKLADFDSTEALAAEVVGIMYGASRRPELGAPAKHLVEPVAHIAGLDATDTLVLERIGRIALDKQDKLVAANELLEGLETEGVTEGRLRESLEILDQEGYIDGKSVIGGGILAMTMTTHGMEEFAAAFLPDYDKISQQVQLAIVNDGLMNSHEIASKVDGSTPLLVNHILDELELHGHVQLSSEIGTFRHIVRASPSLRRTLQG